MKRRREQSYHDLYERIKPYIDQDFKRQEESGLWLTLAVEVIKSLKWLAIIPFPVLWEWIKTKISKGE